MQADQTDRTLWLCKADSVGIYQFCGISDGPQKVSHLEGRADGRQLRHVSSPAAVSTGTLSLLRKVRASAASRFPIQCDTLSLLRKVMAGRKRAVQGPQLESTQADALRRREKRTCDS